MARLAVTHERGETTPPHGDVIRLDVRRPSGAPPTSAVLVAHGFKGFKDWGFFPYLCERLAEDGHLVVSFNFSLNGTGPELVEFSDLDAFGRNTISREVDDLLWMLGQLCAGTWTGRVTPGPVGLLGHSRGGGGVVVAAAEAGEAVSSLATWAGIASFQRWTEEQRREWETAGVAYVANVRTGQQMPIYKTVWDDLQANAERLDVLSAAARVRAPWLVVQGSEDPVVPEAEGRALSEAGPGAELLVLEGADHTFGAGHPYPVQEPTPPLLEAAVEATLRHFRQTLRRRRSVSPRVATPSRFGNR